MAKSGKGGPKKKKKPRGSKKERAERKATGGWGAEAGAFADEEPEEQEEDVKRWRVTAAQEDKTRRVQARTWLKRQQESFEAYRLLGLVEAHYALGDQTASDAVLNELIGKYGREWAYSIAYVLAYRGEADRAFEWLHKAVEDGDPGLTNIVVQPEFGNIQSDPRWLPFLESIGKSPAQLDAIEFKVTLPR